MFLNSFKKIYPIIVSFLIVFFLLNKIDSFDFLKNIKDIDIKSLLFTFLLYFLIKIVNTYRFAYVYNIKSNIKLFSLLSLSNFLLNIVPFRVGEFSYIRLFKKKFGIDSVLALNKLLLIRFFDYIIIYLFFILSSFFVAVSEKGKIVFLISLATSIFLIFLLLAIVLLVFVHKEKARFRSKYFVSFFNYLGEIEKIIFTAKKRKLIIIFSLTFLYWIFRAVLGYGLLLLLGVKITFWFVVFVGFFLAIISLVPIHFFAGIGIFESSWLYFLMQLGYKYENILPILINYHILLLIPIVFFGFLGYLYLKGCRGATT